MLSPGSYDGNKRYLGVTKVRLRPLEVVGEVAPVNTKRRTFCHSFEKIEKLCPPVLPAELIQQMPHCTPVEKVYLRAQN